MRLSEQFQACLRFFYEKVLSVKKAPKRKTNNFHSLRRFCVHKKCCLCCLVFWCFFLGSRPFCKKKKKQAWNCPHSLIILYYWMIPRDHRNIYTIGNSCRDVLRCANMAPGTFTCWRRSLLVANFKFSFLTIRQHSAFKEHLYHILQVTDKVWESHKRIRISTNHSYY